MFRKHSKAQTIRDFQMWWIEDTRITFRCVILVFDQVADRLALPALRSVFLFWCKAGSAMPDLILKHISSSWKASPIDFSKNFQWASTTRSQPDSILTSHTHVTPCCPVRSERWSCLPILKAATVSLSDWKLPESRNHIFLDLRISCTTHCPTQ